MSIKPCRILQVSYVMNREGVQNLLMNLYRHLDRDRFQFDFLINPNGGDYEGAFDQEIRDLGGRIFYAPRFSNNPIAYSRYCDRLFSHHPEWAVVHGHFLRSAAFTYMASAKKNGKYVIAHSHNTCDQAGAVKNALIRSMRFPIRFTADYFMACSHAAGRFAFGRNIVSSSRFQVLKNGIDTSAFRCTQARHLKEKSKLGYAEDTPLYGHVGRFNDQKNHIFLLRVFQKIHQLQPAARLILLGDGPNRQMINAEVRSLGLEGYVRMTGNVSDVSAYLKALDVFILPSLYEGLPLAGVEAQAAGAKCLFADTIDKEAQCIHSLEWMSLQDDPEAWAETAIRLDHAAAYNNDREAATDEVCDAGYDIATSVKDICTRYQIGVEAARR